VSLPRPPTGPGPSRPDGTPSRVGRLAAALARQAADWRAGPGPGVAAYLTQVPDLAADDAAVLQLVAAEIALRRARGEQPRVEEFGLGLLRLWDAIGQVLTGDDPSAGAPPTPACSRSGPARGTNSQPGSRPAPTTRRPTRPGPPRPATGRASLGTSWAVNWAGAGWGWCTRPGTWAWTGPSP